MAIDPVEIKPTARNVKSLPRPKGSQTKKDVNEAIPDHSVLA